MRAGNRWDGTLLGNTFRLIRGEGAYRKILRRSEGAPFQEATENRGQFTTRQDIRDMFQTSWVDGAFWNKPLISAASVRSYFTAEGIDVTSVPGVLFPLPTVTEDTGQVSNIYNPSSSVAVSSSIYAVGVPVTTNLTVREWDGSSWSTFTNEFPVAATSLPTVSLFYDQDQETLVLLVSNGNLYYVNLDDSGSGSIIDAGTVWQEGANAFMHNGRMFVYTGDILREVTDAYGTPVVTTIEDDGMGPDYLNKVSTSAAANDRLVYLSRLALATAEGVYYVKNVEQEGLPTAFIYRVDRTNDGTDIATAVATLPPGVVALDIGWHLGSLQISGTSDIDLVMNNDLSDAVYPRIDIYHLTNGSLGAIGSPLGGDAPDEAPFKFAGNFGAKVYIGGQKRLWVYDAISGGLHPLYDHFRTGVHGGTIGRVYATTDASSQRILRAVDSEFAYFDQEVGTGTDNDSQTRALESVYFDFNIPAEPKTVTHVTLMTDGVGAAETWTIQLSTDDAAFTTVATHTSSENNTEKQRLSTVQKGHRFRYKLSYAATGAVASPSRVKGIVFHAVQGQMVYQWALQIDGNSLSNIENTKMRPEDILTMLEAVGVENGIGTFIDEFKGTSSTHNVKVESVSIERSSPQEIDVAQIVLTEDT